MWGGGIGVTSTSLLAILFMATGAAAPPSDGNPPPAASDAPPAPEREAAPPPQAPDPGEPGELPAPEARPVRRYVESARSSVPLLRSPSGLDRQVGPNPFSGTFSGGLVADVSRGVAGMGYDTPAPTVGRIGLELRYSELLGMTTGLAFGAEPFTRFLLLSERVSMVLDFQVLGFGFNGWELGAGLGVHGAFANLAIPLYGRWMPVKLYKRRLRVGARMGEGGLRLSVGGEWGLF